MPIPENESLRYKVLHDQDFDLDEPGGSFDIDALDAASSLDGSEEVPVVQSGTTVKTTAQDIADLGGGSTPGAVRKYANGVQRDFDPDVDTGSISYLIIDPTATDWLAATEHSNELTWSNPGQVTKVGDASVRFLAFENGSAVTAGSQPTWSTDGSTTVDDGTPSRPIVWTPTGLYTLWAALTEIPAQSIIVENGYAWVSDGGGATGAVKPSFPATPNIGTTQVDDAITWTSLGPCAVWSASSRRSFVVDTPTPATAYSQFLTFPIGAVPDVDYVFQGQPTGNFGTTGASEPAWDDAVSGDTSTWFDGDIMWVENTQGSDPKCVLTGLVAPSGNVAGLMLVAGTGGGVIIEDTAEVENDYSANAASASANVFEDNDANYEMPARGFMPVVYTDAQWHVAPALGSA